MLIRGTLTLRNEVLIAKREALELNQHEAAIVLDVGFAAYVMIEQLNFSTLGAYRAAQRVADVWDIDLEAVMPESLIGEKLVSKIVQSREIEAKRLLGADNRARYLLPSPDAVMEETELHEALAEAIDTMLTARERGILRDRLGINDDQTPMTFTEIAKQRGLSRTRVQSIDYRARRKLSDPRHDNPLAPFIRDAKE